MSWTGIAAMFSARQAPFFHFATPIELPALGAPFVDHVLGTFRKVSRRTQARRDMLRAFEKLHANPYFFRVLVETLLHDPALGVEAARSGPGAYRRRPRLSGRVARAGPRSTRDRTGARRRRRLERLGLADTHTGDWALVDPELAAWVRENDGGPPGP